MPTVFTTPWQWTSQPRPERALVFASRFDGAGRRARWRLFVGGLRLRRAVLASPGALGVGLRAHPLRGHYYTVSMWADEQTLLAFARSQDHRRAVRSIAALGPIRGVLISRAADSRRPPGWRETTRWVDATEPGPYRHEEPVAADRANASTQF